MVQQFGIVVSCVIIGAVLLSRPHPPVKAQRFAVNYLWQDSLATSTTAQDSFFTTAWEQVAIRADAIDIYYRTGAEDTASWTSRDFQLLSEGLVLTYGPATRAKRFEWKSASGSGVVYFEGYKRKPQY